jgi:hypothetical protein
MHDCNRERVPARVDFFDVMIHEAGILMLDGGFHHEGTTGNYQGFGVQIDAIFLKRLFRVFSKQGQEMTLSHLGDQPCWLTKCQQAIHRVEPFLPGEGTPFDIDSWVANREHALDLPATS